MFALRKIVITKPEWFETPHACGVQFKRINNFTWIPGFLAAGEGFLIRLIVDTEYLHYE
jgi:hypothetical protein